MDLLHMLADHDPKPPPNLQLAALAVQSRGEKRKRPGDPAREVLAQAKNIPFMLMGSDTERLSLEWCRAEANGNGSVSSNT